MGWIGHLMIGIVGYGVVISMFGNRLRSGPTVTGILIGVGGWLAMMVLLMPMAGAGLFAMSMGMMAPVLTLVLHVIFGAVLGWTYGKLVADGRADKAARPVGA